MLKILIAECEFLEREYIKKIVRKTYPNTLLIEAVASSKTIKLATEFQPNIIFLSTQVSGLSTIEILEKFREAKVNSNIIVTDNFSKINTEYLQNFNITEFITKPIPSNKLQELVEAYIKYNNINSKEVSKALRNAFSVYPQALLSKEIKDTLDYINENLCEDLSLDFLANRVFLSNYYLSRLFKKEVGVTLSSYILHKKIELAKKLLLETDKNIIEISTILNFKEQTYFCKVFKNNIGISPTEFRKKSS